MEERIIKLDDDLSYHLVRKKIQNSYIRIKNGEVVVTAPLFLQSYIINDFVKDNREKIIKMLKTSDSKRIYSLFNEECTKEEFDYFLEEKGQLYLESRTNYFYNLMNITKKEPNILIKDIKSAYGIYHALGNYITYNKVIFKYSKDVIDYVVVHELAHMKEMNHSKYFWNEVKRILPNYKILRKELKKGV